MLHLEARLCLGVAAKHFKVPSCHRGSRSASADAACPSSPSSRDPAYLSILAPVEPGICFLHKTLQGLHSQVGQCGQEPLGTGAPSLSVSPASDPHVHQLQNLLATKPDYLNTNP